MTDKELITALRKACQNCNPTPCCEYEALGDEAANRIERLQSENARLKAERDKAVDDIAEISIHDNPELLEAHNEKD